MANWSHSDIAQSGYVGIRGEIGGSQAYPNKAMESTPETTRKRPLIDRYSGAT